MFYFGCFPILGLVLIIAIVMVAFRILHTASDVVIGLYLTVKEKVLALFRPAPLESEIEDPNYYAETSLREKLYDKDDGEYISYKEI